MLQVTCAIKPKDKNIINNININNYILPQILEYFWKITHSKKTSTKATKSCIYKAQKCFFG